jgi:hypothetical protein
VTAVSSGTESLSTALSEVKQSWRLLGADIWRDGGCYSASLENGQAIVSLWLQVLSAGDSGQTRYASLYVSLGSDPRMKTTRVPPLGEEAWRDVLSSAIYCAASDIAHQRAAEFAHLLELRVDRAG